MTENSRKVQLESTMDTSKTKTGFQSIREDARAMAKEVVTAGQQADAGLKKFADGANQAQQKLDQATKSIIASVERATAAYKAGEKGTAAYFEQLANQRGANVDTLRPYLNQLRELEAQQNRTGVSAAQTTAALRQLPAQFTDIFTSLASGQQPLLVFTQQFGQIKDSFGGAGNAARAMGGYLLGLISPTTLAAGAAAVLATAWYQGDQEARTFQRTLIATGYQAGVTRGQLMDLAVVVSKSAGGSIGAAAEVLDQLAGSGLRGADALRKAAEAAIELQRAGGAAATQTAKDFASLAKEPLDAAVKLNEAQNFLTASTYQQIKSLQEQGDQAGAAAAAIEAYATAIKGRAPQLEQSLGALERAWRFVAGGAKFAWDAMLGVGRETTVEQQIAKMEQELSKRERFGMTRGDQGVRTEALRQELQLMKDQAAAAQQQAQELGQQAAQQKRLIEYRKDDDKYATRAEQMQQALTRAWNEGVAAGEEYESIARRIMVISQQFDPQTYLDRIATAENQRNELIKRGVLEINALRETGAINEYQSIEQQAAAEMRLIGSRRQALQEQLAIARSRFDSEREISQLQAQMDTLDQQAKTLRTKAELELAAAIDRRRVAMLQAYAAEAEQNRGDIDAFERAEQQSRERLERAQLANADAIEAEAAQLRIELSLMGSTQAQRQRAIDLYKIELDLKKQIREIDEADLPGGEAEREEKRAKARLQAAERAANAQQRAIVDSWTRTTDEINRGLTDALMRGFEDGKGFAENFIATLKNMFATTVLRPVIQPIVSYASNLVGQALGFGGGAGGDLAAASGSGGNRLMSLASMGSNVYRLLTTGIGGSIGSVVSGFGNLVGSANISAFGSGMGLTASQAQAASGAYNAAGMGSIGNSLSMGQTAGAAASVLATLYAGRSIGQMIGGGYSVAGNSGNTAVNTGMAIGAYLGGPLAAAAGAVIGGVVNRAFGRRPKEVTEQGIQGSIGGGDFQGQTYANWVRKGGWFRSNKYGTDMGAVGDELDDSLDSSSSTLLKNTKEWAKAIGLPAEQLDKVSVAIKTKFTGNAEEDQKAIEAVLTQYQEALSGNFKAALAPFQKAGEDLTATLQRLVGLQKFSDTMNSLGGVFSQVAGASVKTKEALLDLFGGADAFIQQATGFVSNYYSREEIAGGKAASIQDTLSGLGISTDFTGEDARAQFRQLVESTDVSTPEGQKRLAALLGIQGDFAQVADYLSETGQSLSQAALQAPESSVLAPLLATTASQQVEATNEVRDAINALHETIKQNASAGGSGDGFVSNTWRETGLATIR